MSFLGHLGTLVVVVAVLFMVIFQAHKQRQARQEWQQRLAAAERTIERQREELERQQKTIELLRLTAAQRNGNR
jgi:cell division protein FtsL